MPPPDIKRVIQPSTKLDLIIGANEDRNWVDVRSTIIYDVFPNDGYFIVAQTDPPILNSMEGETIEASFLWYEDPTSEPKRYAFSSIIQGLEDYELSRGNSVKAVRLKYPKYFYRRNLRFFYRVTPVNEYPIELYVPGYPESLPIIDISGGGICFSHPKLDFLERLKKGERFRLVINFNEEKKMKVLVEVVRKFAKPEMPKISFMAVKFLDLPPTDREFLVTVVKRIERIILRKRAGLI